MSFQCVLLIWPRDERAGCRLSSQVLRGTHAPVVVSVINQEALTLDTKEMVMVAAFQSINSLVAIYGDLVAKS